MILGPPEIAELKLPEDPASTTPIMRNADDHFDFDIQQNQGSSLFLILGKIKCSGAAY